MERKLASIQVIKDLQPIPKADKLELAKIQGWCVVILKGLHKVGDKIVFIELDSLIPKAPWSEFLWKPTDTKEKYRLKSVRLRGQLSQGLAIPLSCLDGLKFEGDTRGNPVYDWEEGKDVTALLGIEKYNPVIPACLAGVQKGDFPAFIPRTDETRIQSCLDVLQEIRGRECYISTKVDGASATFFLNRGQFGVCSRNIELCETETNTFWKLARQYDLEAKLRKLGRDIAIQGEAHGSGIQGNPLNIAVQALAVFNIYDISAAKYVDHHELVALCKELDLPMVKVDCVGIFKPEWGLPELLVMAEGCYIGTNNPREGIVIRPTVESRSKVLSGRLSFKVINNTYLEREE